MVSPPVANPRTGSRARALAVPALGWGLAAFAACGRVGFDEGPPPGTDDAAAGGRSPGAGGAGSGGAEPEDASSGGTPANGGTPASGGAFDAGNVDASLDADAADASDAADSRPDAPVCPGPSPPVIDYCSTILYLSAVPVIDGALDCGLRLAELVPVGWTGSTATPEATAEFAVGWRPDGVYFFVRVHDPNLVPPRPEALTWEGDGVELYLDSDGFYGAPPAYDDPGTRQFTIAAPASAMSSVSRAQSWYPGFTGTADWTSTAYRAFGTADGYVVEAFVVGDDLGLPTLALTTGARVGMDLSIGVSYPTDQGMDASAPGNRLGQYFLRVADAAEGGALPPFDPRAFCRPLLDAP